jgi:hypothetical protein
MIVTAFLSFNVYFQFFKFKEFTQQTTFLFLFATKAFWNQNLLSTENSVNITIFRKENNLAFVYIEKVGQ